MNEFNPLTALQRVFADTEVDWKLLEGEDSAALTPESHQPHGDATTPHKAQQASPQHT